MTSVTIASGTVSIYNPQGVTLASTSVGTGGTSIGIQLPVSGTYTIMVDPNSTNTGNMTLVLATATLSVGQANVMAGGSVTVNWAGIGLPATNDFLGLYTPGSSDQSIIGNLQYTGSTATSGNKNIVIPPSLAPGTYELRLFAQNNFSARLATSNTFTVTSP